MTASTSPGEYLTRLDTNGRGLTTAEHTMMSLLVEAHPSLVPLIDIEAALHSSEPRKSNVTQVIVSRLRRKLRLAGLPGSIQCVRRNGYRLAIEGKQP